MITGAVVSTTSTVLVTAVASFPDASEAVYVNVYVPKVSTSTVPVVVTVISPETSVAVAPASEYVPPNSTVIEALPTRVITGAVVSTTSTVLILEAVLPEISVAVYVTVYVPTAEVSTLDVVVTVTTPSFASAAVAPASVYTSPSSTVTVVDPFIEITGGTVSGDESPPAMEARAATPTVAIKAFWIADSSAEISASLLSFNFLWDGL